MVQFHDTGEKFEVHGLSTTQGCNKKKSWTLKLQQTAGRSAVAALVLKVHERAKIDRINAGGPTRGILGTGSPRAPDVIPI